VRLGLAFAVQQRAFRTFLVIDDEGDGDSGAAGPLRVEAGAAVAVHVPEEVVFCVSGRVGIWGVEGEGYVVDGLEGGHFVVLFGWALG
jgi:hypothetical protein